MKPAPGNKKHLDEKLDEALKGTFPASDPIELTPQAQDEETEDDEEADSAAEDESD